MTVLAFGLHIGEKKISFCQELHFQVPGKKKYIYKTVKGQAHMTLTCQSDLDL